MIADIKRVLWKQVKDVKTCRGLMSHHCTQLCPTAQKEGFRHVDVDAFRLAGWPWHLFPPEPFELKRLMTNTCSVSRSPTDNCCCQLRR